MVTLCDVHLLFACHAFFAAGYVVLAIDGLCGSSACQAKQADVSTPLFVNKDLFSHTPFPVFFLSSHLWAILLAFGLLQPSPVILRYSSVPAAEKCKAAMDGRQFDDNTLKASFVAEPDFYKAYHGDWFPQQ
eukprot:1155263-Pelagomonas_calceolata.AAC.1